MPTSERADPARIGRKPRIQIRLLLRVQPAIDLGGPRRRRVINTLS
jgi:hypothetical protein